MLLPDDTLFRGAEKAMRILLSFLFALALIPQVRAATVADFRNLGFSPDGRHFAFMEYGVQDGSGFPFASVFVIDLDRDAWAGPPVRIVLEKEAEDAREAMRMALRRAAPTLKRAGIAPLLTGRELFHAPPTEGTEAAITATFTGWPWQSGDARWKYVLQLSTFSMPGGDCVSDVAESARGFALDVLVGVEGRRVRLYADRNVPASRHCPIAYAIDRVIRFTVPGGINRTLPVRDVVIIRYGHPAFEGLDQRYLAIPVKLPEPSAR